MRARACSILLAASMLSATLAHAQPEPPPDDPAPPPAAPSPPPPAPPPAPAAPLPPKEPSVDDALHSNDPERKEDLTPRPAEPPTRGGQKFTADPIADTGIIALGLTFGVLSSAMLSTGEIRPQQIAPNFETKQLLSIDRGAVRQSIDPDAHTFSNFGLYAAVAYAVGDSIADIWREGKTAALVDAIMYAEAAAITQGITNLAKIAFRRPRPIAYIERNEAIARGVDPNTYDNAETDSSLSFFSAHTSAVASLGAAATYIAFTRSGVRSLRPWFTLGGSTLLTSFVAYERVRGGSHFPTDVMAGALAGTAVGALVVHLHREDSLKQRPVWIGVSPTYEGGILTASGLF